MSEKVFFLQFCKTQRITKNTPKNTNFFVHVRKSLRERGHRFLDKEGLDLVWIMYNEKYTIYAVTFRDLKSRNKLLLQPWFDSLEKVDN